MGPVVGYSAFYICCWQIERPKNSAYKGALPKNQEVNICFYLIVVGQGVYVLTLYCAILVKSIRKYYYIFSRA